MSNIVNWVSAGFLISGAIFCLIGTLGLFRMPTFITRVHAASLIDSLGSILILTGLMLLAGFSVVTIKLFLILVFLLLTGPTAIHALASTALHEDASLITGKEESSNT